MINLGTAASTAAKEAAFIDLVRLTQLLVRGATWEKLGEATFVKIAQKLTAALSIRFTKKSLGKLIPVVGVAVGASLNWATLEAVVDSADIAYRRRFLLASTPTSPTTATSPSSRGSLALTRPTGRTNRSASSMTSQNRTISHSICRPGAVMAAPSEKSSPVA
ncbi:EcsC family protein [Oerskovia sp. M15]